MNILPFRIHSLSFISELTSNMLTGVSSFGVHFVLLAFLLVGITPARALSDEPTSADLVNYYASTEKWLAQPSRSEEEIKTVSGELARKYMADERVQEAIWVLKSAGDFDQARKLEQWLSKILTQSELKFVKSYASGAQGAKLFKINGSEIQFVEKARPAFPGGTEIVASILDRYLDLNVVPLTVEATNSEGTIVSRQYFVRDSVHAYDATFEELRPEFDAMQDAGEYVKAAYFRARADWVHLASHGYPPHLKNMWLLDYLLDNGDRHGEKTG